MKILLILFITVYSLNETKGQQFSFQMHFMDAIGNKDTITLGYDLSATDSIDPSFGEENIISTPLNIGLDVRITNELKNRSWFSIPGTYHTKKQIIDYNCTSFKYENIQAIDIYTPYWPVTASWDTTLFSDICRKGSLFTSIHPGGWWDTGSSSDLMRQVLLANDSVTFTSNISGGPNYGYINKSGDSISVFWQAIGPEYILFTSVHESPKRNMGLLVYPNPCSDHISIELTQELGNIKSLQILSTLGNPVLATNKTKDINISQLGHGLYLIVMTNEKGDKRCARFVKE